MTLDKPLRKPAPPPTPHTETYWPPRKCNCCKKMVRGPREGAPDAVVYTRDFGE